MRAPLPDDHALMTVKEVAALLKCKAPTVYKMANEGRIPSFKVGGVWRFDPDSILNWMSAQERAHCG